MEQKEVLNVDFAQHALDVGRRNAELNEVGDAKFRILREDCIPVLRQLRGLGVKGKAARQHSHGLSHKLSTLWSWTLPDWRRVLWFG